MFVQTSRYDAVYWRNICKARKIREEKLSQQYSNVLRVRVRVRMRLCGAVLVCMSRKMRHS